MCSVRGVGRIVSLEDIRYRHENLVNMVSTQSAVLLSERRSQAHKDRGELLEIVKDLKERNAALLMEIPDEAHERTGS